MLFRSSNSVESVSSNLVQRSADTDAEWFRRFSQLGYRHHGLRPGEDPVDNLIPSRSDHPRFRLRFRNPRSTKSRGWSSHWWNSHWCPAATPDDGQFQPIVPGLRSHMGIDVARIEQHNGLWRNSETQFRVRHCNIQARSGSRTPGTRTSSTSFPHRIPRFLFVFFYKNDNNYFCGGLPHNLDTEKFLGAQSEHACWCLASRNANFKLWIIPGR